jgi:hypothetical protein
MFKPGLFRPRHNHGRIVAASPLPIATVDKTREIMFNKIAESLRPSQATSLAKSFRRLGWSGFWIQVLMAGLPVLLMLYMFTFSQSATGPSSGLPFVEYLTITSFLILLFTVYWFFRYTRLAPRIADAHGRPTQSTLIATVWTGVLASVLGILFSMVVMLLDVGNLLFHFLSAPQVGVPVVQAQGLAPASWVSAVDMLSVMSLILTLGAEVVVLILGLWLLFRTSQRSQEYP